MVFEEFGFRSFLAAPAAPLALRGWAAARPDLAANPAGAGLVVDAGFSFTHAVPVLDGRVLAEGVRRVNVGGKALTNYLKELVSYRQAFFVKLLSPGNDRGSIIEVERSVICMISTCMCVIVLGVHEWRGVPLQGPCASDTSAAPGIELVGTAGWRVRGVPLQRDSTDRVLRHTPVSQTLACERRRSSGLWT